MTIAIIKPHIFVDGDEFTLI